MPVSWPGAGSSGGAWSTGSSGGASGPAANGYSAALQALAPSSSWRLGESSGVAADSSAAAPGTVTLGTGGVRGVTGLLNNDSDKAIQLPADGFIDFGANYSFAGNTAFSAGVVVSPSSLTPGTSFPIFGRHDGANAGWMLLYDGGLYFFRGNAGERIGTAVFEVGSKMHLGVTYDNAFRRLYVNGCLVNKVADVAALTAPASATLRLGSMVAYGRGMPGVYDEAFVKAGAFTSAQMLDLATKALAS